MTWRQDDGGWQVILFDDLRIVVMKWIAEGVRS
jgi:hypothetical protein